MAEARPGILGEIFGDPGGPDPGEATSSTASASSIRERAAQELSPEMGRMGAEDPSSDFPATTPQRVAIVTGANRGIGLEVVRHLAQRDYTVVLGSRDIGKGEAAAKELTAGDRVLVRRLDVTRQSDIDRLRDEIAQTFGSLHVLVNNAAIHYDTDQNAFDADLQVVQEALDTNLLGAWRMCKSFIPLLRKGGHGRIVNVSSEAGSLAEMGAARRRMRSARPR